jgi:hypothetical protein
MSRVSNWACIALGVWLLGAMLIVIALPDHVSDGLVFWTGGLALLAFISWKERG